MTHNLIKGCNFTSSKIQNKKFFFFKCYLDFALQCNSILVYLFLNWTDEYLSLSVGINLEVLISVEFAAFSKSV